MIQKIEGIDKQNRKAFKDSIKAISEKYNVIFRNDEALVSYQGDYIVTDESLEAKGRAKNALYQFIHDFRLKQFNSSIVS